MKILFVNSPFNRLKKLYDFYYPLGLGYLSAFLKENGFETAIYNADAPKKDEFESLDNTYKNYISTINLVEEAFNNDDHYVWKEIRQVFKDFKPDILAISVMSAKYEISLKIAQIYKYEFERGNVVFGGPHPTVDPENVLKNDELDFVVRGEGEETLLELCNYLRDKKIINRKIKGISFKDNGVIIHNQPRPLIHDLDKLPFPDRKSLFFSDRFDKTKFAVIITSRGCSYKCAYCAAKTMWGIRVRSRSNTQVIKELKYITKEFGLEDIMFWDDSFTLNKKRIVELCDLIIKNRLNVMWSCTTRVNLVNAELLKKMKKANCRAIDFGVESGSERMLKLISKGITVKQAKDAIFLAKKFNIQANTFFMIGFPDETIEDIKETIKLIKSLVYSVMCLSIFTPYPETPLYERVKELGLIPKEFKWYRHSHQSIHNSFNKNIPSDKFKELILEMVNLCDKMNNSLRCKLAYYNSLKSYYINNPNLFFKKIFKKIV